VKQVRTLAACVLLAACAASSAHRPSTLDATFTVAKLARIRALAPDFLARAEQARAQAAATSDDAERADQEARAQLLLDAAAAEAERIEIDRNRATLEAQALAWEQVTTQAGLERTNLELELKLMAAAKIAEQEAARAFEQAELAEDHSLPNRKERGEARKAAAAFLLRRAKLTLAAARAMGASEPQLTAADRAIAGAEQKPSGDAASLQAVQGALALAERALGDARAKSPAPSPEAVQDLLARASELGVAATRAPRGVILGVPSAFAPGSAALANSAQRKLVLLRDLLGAFPHGELRIEAHAQAGSAAASQKLALARAQRVRTYLIATLPAERVVAVSDAAALASDDGIDLVLPAYGAPP
jgi:outer membrane protein OmpA-like peptidoglycan-associated protein